MRRRTFSLLFLLCFTSLSFASEGGKEGHGGDITNDADHIWFHGEPVEYCITRHPNFLYEEAEVRKTIKDVFSAWNRFMEKWDLDQPAELAPKKQFLRAKTFVEVPECTDPKGQLEFVLGDVKHRLVQKYDGRLRNSLGAALNWEESVNSARHGGIIWIRSPRISMMIDFGDYFRLLLLHEVGHIFGMPHDSVYAMSANVARLLYFPHYSRVLSSIEAPHWKFNVKPGSEMNLTYHLECGSENGQNNYTIPKAVREHWKIPEKGCFTARLSFDKREEKESLFTLRVKSGDTQLEFSGKFAGPTQEKGGPRVVSIFQQIYHDIDSYQATLFPAGSAFQWSTAIGFQFKDELSGYFTGPTGEKMGALLDSKRNHILHLFDVETGEWWKIGEQDYLTTTLGGQAP